jgi:tRNA pseudouridine32 synthase/23S rRNA pseudouridine746 synthase
VEDWALYQLQPLTGHRHQLRIHMMTLGMPIAGDQLYPLVLRAKHEEEDFSQCLQLLAQRIAFTDPVTGEERDWQSRRCLQITHAD